MSPTKLQKIFIWDPCHPKAIKDVDTARDIDFTVCAAFSDSTMAPLKSATMQCNLGRAYMS
jgi:3-oxoacyl-[acyl-carrier-protein] synthase III